MESNGSCHAWKNPRNVLPRNLPNQEAGQSGSTHTKKEKDRKQKNIWESGRDSKLGRMFGTSLPAAFDTFFDDNFLSPFLNNTNKAQHDDPPRRTNRALILKFGLDKIS